MKQYKKENKTLSLRLPVELYEVMSAEAEKKATTIQQLIVNYFWSAYNKQITELKVGKKIATNM